MRRALLTLALLAGSALPALAHENGTIALTPKQVGVGGNLSVRGDKLAKSSTLKMQLRGTLETFDLAEVRTDSAGRFLARLALPAEVKAGNYVVVVVAADGDVSARANLVVSAAETPAADASAGMEGHAGMPMAPGTPDQHPTAEAMEVRVSTSGAEWAAIVAIIGLSAAAGLGLLLGARRSAGA